MTVTVRASVGQRQEGLPWGCHRPKQLNHPPCFPACALTAGLEAEVGLDLKHSHGILETHEAASRTVPQHPPFNAPLNSQPVLGNLGIEEVIHIVTTAYRSSGSECIFLWKWRHKHPKLRHWNWCLESDNIDLTCALKTSRRSGCCVSASGYSNVFVL